MRAMRITQYAPHDLSPLTVVVRESDITVELDELVQQTIAGQPGIFYVFDAFESAEDIVRTTVHGQERTRPDEERNMAILYYWSAQQLRLVREGGDLVCQDPAPLTAVDVEAALKQLAQHPNYSQTKRVTCRTSDGHLITLAKGEVKRERIAA